MSKISDNSMLKIVATATSLMPSKQFRNYREIEDLHEQFISVLVEDIESKKYLLVAPKNGSSDSVVEHFHEEIKITESIADGFKKKKLHTHFEVPHIVAHNSKVAVFIPYSGRAFAPGALSGNQVKALATALAKIHSASFAIVEDNSAIINKIVETNAQTRVRLISALDEISALGLIPVTLISKFQDFLNLDDMWSYTSTVIHGSIVPSNVLFTGEGVSYILEWSRIRIGDYALDLAGIVPALTNDNTTIFFETYRKAKSKLGSRSRSDQNLDKRVEFYYQFELAEKLLVAQKQVNEETVSKLVEELELLDKKLTLGQELDLVEAEAQKITEQKRMHAENLAKQDVQFTQKMMRSEIVSLTSEHSHNTGAVSSSKTKNESSEAIGQETTKLPVGPRASFEAPVIHAPKESVAGVQSRKQFNIEDFLED
ncbi:MAG: phosphotransferase [Candidatus Ancillula sp.]|jgi:thiamine kinase-like enzyme|nr:phosphotransferase [Candidatus Ancillula sp.]